MHYENIILSREDAVATIRLNRPEALNTLNSALMAELSGALDILEVDDAIGAIIITGSERAFAAGADIKEMKDRDTENRRVDRRKVTSGRVYGKGGRQQGI